MKPKIFKHYTLKWNSGDKSYCYYCRIDKNQAMNKIKDNSDIKFELESKDYPLYENGKIIEFEDIHRFDKYIPNDRIDDILKSFPLYISFGTNNKSVKYFRCNLVNNNIIIKNEFEKEVYSSEIREEMNFRQTVCNLVKDSDVKEILSNLNLVQELLENNFYYD